MLALPRAVARVRPASAAFAAAASALCPRAAAFSTTRAAAAVLPRDKAPNFTLPAVVGTSITKVSLSDYAGRWVVLISYPLDFTFVCPTELVSFSDRLADFSALGADVLAISADSAFSHLAWQQMPRAKGGLGGVGMPLLADLGGNTLHEYGCLIENPEDTDAWVPFRATYLIDPAGECGGRAAGGRRRGAGVGRPRAWRAARGAHVAPPRSCHVMP